MSRWRTGVSLASLLAVTAFPLAGATGVSAEPGRYIVKFKDPKRGRAALKRANGFVHVDLDPQGAVAAEVPDDGVEALLRDPEVEYVEVDPIRGPMAESVPYGIQMVDADRVSDAAAGNVTMCIVDSGYALDHEDLPDDPARVTGAGNSRTGDWHHDGCGHGTHVAGTIAALGRNGVGVLGVLPSGLLRLHIIKIFNDRCGWTFASSLIDALNQCEKAGADVINMSLGGRHPSETERAAFEDAFRKGMLVVAAAGNDGSTRRLYPASYDAVISAAAVDEMRRIASFSQQNDQVELAAPGVRVLSTVPSGYAFLSGTSMATAHVSGVAALVWSQRRDLTNVQLRFVLRSTAEDRGTPGRDNAYGYGLVNALAALEGAVCRPTEETETRCADGIDNDCDLFTDAADPDCRTVRSCIPLHEPCAGGGSCCAGQCRGFRGVRVCR
jgi:serine protease